MEISRRRLQGNSRVPRRLQDLLYLLMGNGLTFRAEIHKFQLAIGALLPLHQLFKPTTGKIKDQRRRSCAGSTLFTTGEIYVFAASYRIDNRSTVAKSQVPVLWSGSISLTHW